MLQTKHRFEVSIVSLFYIGNPFDEKTVFAISRNLFLRGPASLPNAGSPNASSPKQYRHGDLPKRHFAKSPVP
jgi:hypothetical protein